jgi:hypothetical protein
MSVLMVTIRTFDLPRARGAVTMVGMMTMNLDRPWRSTVTEP